MNNSWFSHDSNARNSKKLIRLRQKHGAEGYGVYWMLIERLREEEGYTSDLDYDMIAFDLRVDQGLIKSVVEDFGLFEVSPDNRSFTAHGLAERMELRDAKSAAGKKGAKARWGADKNPDEMAPDGKVIADPVAKPDSAYSYKGKERKEKKIYSSSLSSSLPSEDSEEQQEEFFISELFFKNIAQPMDEFRKFRNYNNTGGRHWAKMDESERMSAFELWTPKGKSSPRFKPDTLSAWKIIYDALGSSGASREIRMSALDDGIRFLVSDAYCIICCPEILPRYIEDSPEFSTLFLPGLTALAKSLGKSKINYQPYGTK